MELAYDLTIKTITMKNMFDFEGSKDNICLIHALVTSFIVYKRRRCIYTICLFTFFLIIR